MTEVKELEPEISLKKRWDHIDLLEAVACLLVIIYHSTTVNCTIYGESSVWNYIHYMMRPIISICVPLFFLTNGFLLLNKPFDLKKHIIRILRLILLTLFWGCINLLILMPIEETYLSLSDFIWAIYWWKQGFINHFWFMGALVCIYIFFPLIKLAFNQHKNIFLYFTIVCAILTFGNVFICMILTLFKYIITGKENYISMNMFNIFNPLQGIFGYAFVYFCCGGLLGKYHNTILEKIKNIKWINTFTLLLTILLSTVCLGLWGIFSSKLIHDSYDVVWNGYDTIFTAINVLCIYLLSTKYQSKNNLINKYIKLISINTLGIYFLHAIFIHLFNKLGVSSWNFMNNYLANTLYAFIILNICLIITYLIKKIPYVKKIIS